MEGKDCTSCEKKSNIFLLFRGDWFPFVCMILCNDLRGISDIK